jgi:NitT/TauT family transport system substrate-binding protein
VTVRSRTILAGAVAFALTASACGGDNSDRGEAAGDGLTTITLSQPLPKSIAFYPLFVGEELGYFEEEGLRVELVPSGDVNPMTVVPSGQADFGAMSSADLLIGASQGLALDVVFEYYQKNVFSIIVPEDSDVKSVKDLRGGTVGIPRESGAEVAIARTALGDAGVDPDADVKFLAVGDAGPQVINALQDGQIAAYVGAIQDLVALRVAGFEFQEITPDNIAEQPASSLFAMEETLEDLGPDLVRGFLRAWAKATYAGMTAPEKVLEMAASQVPDEASDPEFAQALLDISVELQTPVAGEDAFGELRRDQWDTIAQQLVSAGELESVPDLAELLNDQHLEVANDWDRAGVEQDIADWTA